MEDFILLPTGKPAQRGQIIQEVDRMSGKRTIRLSHNHSNQVFGWKPAQHLYQTSYEGIEKGDFYLMAFGEDDYEVVESNSQEDADRATSHPTISSVCRKVIATTDPSLNLPSIPEQTIQAFIQYYNSK